MRLRMKRSRRSVASGSSSQAFTAWKTKKDELVREKRRQERRDAREKARTEEENAQENRISANKVVLRTLIHICVARAVQYYIT